MITTDVLHIDLISHIGLEHLGATEKLRLNNFLKTFLCVHECAHVCVYVCELACTHSHMSDDTSN